MPSPPPSPSPSPSPAAASSPPPPPPKPSPPKYERWPSKAAAAGYTAWRSRVAPTPVRIPYYEPIGGTTGPHRMAGELPPKPKPVIEYTPSKPYKPRGAPKVGFLSNIIRKVRGKEKWPSLGGSGGYHRMSGNWPPPSAAAPAAVATAPAAATSTVTSWYDSGKRLGGAAAAPAPEAASSVVSWYDSGKRLSAPSMVASWYDSGRRL